MCVHLFVCLRVCVCVFEKVSYKSVLNGGEYDICWNYYCHFYV